MRHRPNSADGANGYSLVEVLFVLGVTATLSGIAVPHILAALDELRTQGAVRYMSSRLQRTRMQALVRSSNVAMRFTRDGSAVSYAIYADGNGNGVLARDIDRGVDREIQASERLPDNFYGVEFGTLAGLPAADASSAPPGTDPIRLGSSDMVSFTALGTSTSGSLYIRGPRQTQYAIRVFGESGKTRLLRFDSHNWRWEPL